MIRIIWSLIIAILSPIIFWFGGYNFDHRGEAATMCAILYLGIFFIAITYPGQYLGEKE